MTQNAVNSKPALGVSVGYWGGGRRLGNTAETVVPVVRADVVRDGQRRECLCARHGTKRDSSYMHMSPVAALAPPNSTHLPFIF